jgi:hypothetical protein
MEKKKQRQVGGQAPRALSEVGKPSCECCGRRFRLQPVNGVKSDSSPSVDRIIPSLGYVLGNVALLCWRCNNLKRNATPDELLTIAKWLSGKLAEKGKFDGQESTG